MDTPRLTTPRQPRPDPFPATVSTPSAPWPEAGVQALDGLGDRYERRWCRRSRWAARGPVLNGDGAQVEPVERYLAYLTDIQRSPNTIKAYAHDLKD